MSFVEELKQAGIIDAKSIKARYANWADGIQYPLNISKDHVGVDNTFESNNEVQVLSEQEVLNHKKQVEELETKIIDLKNKYVTQ